MRAAWALAVAHLAILLALGPAFAEIAGSARVIDGDTIEILGERVRLAGIDAPESKQYCEQDGLAYPCGVMATAWLVERTLGRSVRCDGDERDRYGRLLAVCWSEGTNLNDALVRAGWAVAYMRYSRAYVDAETQARNAHAGMWAGGFARPSAWRRNDRDPIVAEFPTTCIVKGNVNGDGERIYHAPGAAAYDRVTIHPDQGDRCFDSEEEALASGFRRSVR